MFYELLCSAYPSIFVSTSSCVEGLKPPLLILNSNFIVWVPQQRAYAHCSCVPL